MENKASSSYQFNSTNGSGDEKEEPDKQFGFNDIQTALITKMLNDSLVNTVSKPQLPNFFKDKPELWFILLEIEFNANKTTNDDTKSFEH